MSFPKTKKYTLGLKLDNTTLEIFELILKIPNVSKDQKLEILQTISSKIDLLKLLLRFAKDTDSIETNQYLHLEEILQEIGKMAGGWLRYFKNS